MNKVHYGKLNMITLFKRYFSVGIINTCIHWTVFTSIYYVVYQSQAISNFFGFMAAVTFSFFANSIFTFRVKPTTSSYFYFTSFMGLLSYCSGLIADNINLPIYVTMISFSVISLIIGFFYSSLFVFRYKNEKK